MIDVASFFSLLKSNDMDFFSGVPDSLLEDICAYITDNSSNEKNIIASNEGIAVGIASGYYLSTGKTPVVYMQNSGLGNAINPLISLADRMVYQIPIFLLIGWRGEPGNKDEPQHLKQGEITLNLLEVLKIPYQILDDDEGKGLRQVSELILSTKENLMPHALVIKKNTFSNYKLNTRIKNEFLLTREDALKAVLNHLNDSDIIISTTGKLSRELFEYREMMNQSHKNDFLTVGSMGHSSAIALGIALNKKEKNVFCLDGDGALLMHMGVVANIGSLRPKNFKHIVFNNGVHESVGGQPTVAFQIDIPKIIKACGYSHTFSAENYSEVESAVCLMKNISTPVFLEIRINSKSRSNLGRPSTTPIENKIEFMKNLELIDKTSIDK